MGIGANQITATNAGGTLSSQAERLWLRIGGFARYAVKAVGAANEP